MLESVRMESNHQPSPFGDALSFTAKGACAALKPRDCEQQIAAVQAGAHRIEYVVPMHVQLREDLIVHIGRISMVQRMEGFLLVNIGDAKHPTRIPDADGQLWDKLSALAAYQVTIGEEQP